jgi:hypothetical protein
VAHLHFGFCGGWGAALRLAFRVFCTTDQKSEGVKPRLLAHELCASFFVSYFGAIIAPKDEP